MGADPITYPTVSTVVQPQTSTIDLPVQPKVPGDRAAQVPGGAVSGSGRRQASDRDRPRTLVTGLVVNLDAPRVALLAADGPPYRGEIDTDLVEGVYAIRPDPRQHLWIFEPRQVRSGLRFDLTIDGPDPFSLTYGQPLLLVVTHGLDGDRFDTLAAAVNVIDSALHDHTPDRWADALDYLCLLNAVDLYDLLDELEATHSGVVGDLLLHFAEAAKLSDLQGQAGVLRALESFARKPSEYYVDGFDSWQVAPKSFAANPERQRAGLTNIQLVLTFDAVPPVRALTVYADDILDDSATEPTPPRYGPLSLTYPTRLTRGTTPKLFAAKQAAIAQIEAQNAEFFTTSFKLTAQVLLGVYQATLSVAKIDAASEARGYQPRAERGPGQWRQTFEGGTNMSDEAAAYENSSCGTPSGMGYYVDEVQFEGYRNGKLLDAKFWRMNGRMGRFIRYRPDLAETKVFNQATRQLTVANKYGAGVQWRVADPQMADLLRNFMQGKGLAVEIVYIAP
jgi:hypothetical protein